jgi:TRAP transporter 4TM/12TM fusion protein
MTEKVRDPEEVRDDELLEEFEAERPGRRLSGVPAVIVAVAGAGLSLFAISWVLNPLEAGAYRPAFLAVALFLTFLVFGGRSHRDARPTLLDWALAVASLVAVGYASVTSDELFRHAADPDVIDLVFGVATILLVLEATRRTVGWILPAICLAFIVYAYFGGLIPDATRLGHKGYGLDRIVGQSYLGLEGIFGVPLDVAATYIVLFAIYGAVLEYSGASRFFVEISHAAFGRSRTGPGRTTTLAGFLLGTVSGSGVATTVTLGSVSWPLLRRAGYPKDEGGGILAAAGIGAILSPPTMGAAAFIIAELLEISYLEVLVYALVPSLLYYVGVLLAIEADARRHGVEGIDLRTAGFWRLLARSGYHFSSLVLIVVLLAIGISPFRAVLYAAVLAFLLSFLDRRDRMGPRKVWDALVAGARGVLPIAATTAAAGLIVAVISLTGLGLELSALIVDASGGSLALTAIFSAIAVLVLGLAVPVTASFIIAAVIIAPALVALGVEDFAAFMFVFYYAVLSEVSPPTALSAFAAAAITGGDGFRTMMLTFRYTLPAFLVPFAFVLSPNGEGLLLQGDIGSAVLVILVSAVAVFALAIALGGWLRGPAGVPVRVLALAAGLVLLYLEPLWVGIGLGLLAAAVALQLALRAARPTATGTGAG